jgi:hypothetical protein
MSMPFARLATLLTHLPNNIAALQNLSAAEQMKWSELDRTLRKFVGPELAAALMITSDLRVRVALEAGDYDPTKVEQATRCLHALLYSYEKLKPTLKAVKPSLVRRYLDRYLDEVKQAIESNKLATEWKEGPILNHAFEPEGALANYHRGKALPKEWKKERAAMQNASPVWLHYHSLADYQFKNGPYLQGILRFFIRHVRGLDSIPEGEVKEIVKAFNKQRFEGNATYMLLAQLMKAVYPRLSAEDQRATDASLAQANNEIFTTALLYFHAASELPCYTEKLPDLASLILKHYVAKPPLVGIETSILLAYIAAHLKAEDVRTYLAKISANSRPEVVMPFVMQHLDVNKPEHRFNVAVILSELFIQYNAQGLVVNSINFLKEFQSYKSALALALSMVCELHLTVRMPIMPQAIIQLARVYDLVLPSLPGTGDNSARFSLTPAIAQCLTLADPVRSLQIIGEYWQKFTSDCLPLSNQELEWLNNAKSGKMPLAAPQGQLLYTVYGWQQETMQEKLTKHGGSVVATFADDMVIIAMEAEKMKKDVREVFGLEAKKLTLPHDFVAKRDYLMLVPGITVIENPKGRNTLVVTYPAEARQKEAVNAVVDEAKWEIRKSAAILPKYNGDVASERRQRLLASAAERLARHMENAALGPSSP